MAYGAFSGLMPTPLYKVTHFYMGPLAYGLIGFKYQMLLNTNPSETHTKYLRFYNFSLGRLLVLQSFFDELLLARSAAAGGYGGRDASPPLELRDRKQFTGFFFRRPSSLGRERA